MPRYYFHIREGDDLAHDDEGLDLPDLETAQKEALEAARDMLVELIRSGLPVNGQCFEICDEKGKVLQVVPFRKVLNLT
ncbi:DUF6894 family protein [Oryzifoliimicrobium ureilyticus]|uniref:DUF6894 family protein n=1 Tax=Oryzifoliimicrobium ureilyticus TaxID=3113724 RepID=UPI003076084A